MSLERLWSGWRSAYVTGVVEGRGASGDSGDDRPEGTLFERLLRSEHADEETFVVHRGATCSVVMNIYPYTNGHVMVLPNRAVADLGDLTDDEHTELWQLVRTAAATVRAAFGCEGMNIGINLGDAGGAGVPDHLHVHVVPRWRGDTNFMTTTANARVLPVSLLESWQRLRDAWPAA